MLSYDDALVRILASVSGPLEVEVTPLLLDGVYESAAASLPLLTDVVADADLPPFDNSAIDGYAVHSKDTEGASQTRPVVLPVTRVVAAGIADLSPLAQGEAAQIFTGAALPPGATGLVMVEDTTPGDDNTVQIHAPARSGLIRRAGSDVVRGEAAIRAGEPMTPGVVGLLASLNRTEIEVARAPRVALLTTGDEVVPLGDDPLEPGEIRNSNGPALAAAIVGAGGQVWRQRHVPDDLENTRVALEMCVSSKRFQPDIIIASGGVSVGERDFVKAAVEEIGTLDLWRVAIKPGKPLAFGRINGSLFFGLPGNPVSGLVTFELFVRPVIRKMLGYRDLMRPQVSARLTQPLRHEKGRREFVRVRLQWRDDTYHATPTGTQGSHRLSSLLEADALLIAHESHGDYTVGDRLPALLLR